MVSCFFSARGDPERTIQYRLERKIKMLYLVWGLVGVAVVLGFLFGISLQGEKALQDESIGELLVFLPEFEEEEKQFILHIRRENLDFLNQKYVVMRVKKVHEKRR